MTFLWYVSKSAIQIALPPILNRSRPLEKIRGSSQLIEYAIPSSTASTPVPHYQKIWATALNTKFYISTWRDPELLSELLASYIANISKSLNPECSKICELHPCIAT